MRPPYVFAVGAVLVAACTSETTAVPDTPTTDTSKTAPTDGTVVEAGSPPSPTGPGSGTSSGGMNDAGSAEGGTPPPTTTCTPVAANCAGGGSMSYCVSLGGGGCTAIAYEYAGTKYACVGCASCTDAYYAAYTACLDAVGACTALSACCDVMGAGDQVSCRATVSDHQGQRYGDVTCKGTLESYRSSGLCP
jgi:hypothetical protein